MNLRRQDMAIAFCFRNNNIRQSSYWNCEAFARRCDVSYRGVIPRVKSNWGMWKMDMISIRSQ